MRASQARYRWITRALSTGERCGRSGSITKARGRRGPAAVRDQRCAGDQRAQARAAAGIRRGCRISPPRRATAEARAQMRRSNGFWEGAETNQSPGNRPRPDTSDLCDSLRRKRKARGRCKPAVIAPAQMDGKHQRSSRERMLAAVLVGRPRLTALNADFAPEAVAYGLRAVRVSRP
jgi:hypothetical protein